MSKEQEYREHASEMLSLAQRTQNSDDKARLLKVAEAWLDLADRARAAAASPPAPTDGAATVPPRLAD
jgi:hypothetical protein